ncbi:MAG: rod shape-determining protein MreC [Proteobacteria bacterium]|nr:rod shape-determining protein MreC [Pseudomonadota bacterium]
MRRSQGRNPRNGNLARGLAQQASIFVFLLVSVALLIAGKIDPKLSNAVQGVLVDVAAPIVDTVGKPIEAVREFGRRSGDVLQGADRIEELRTENEALRRWKNVALRLDDENAQLRALVRVQDRQDIPMSVAHVVSDTTGPFLRAVILDVGALDGIERHQPVLDEVGVVGRVNAVGRNSSRALLITDLNSRVPVIVVRTGTRAILAGDNGPRPWLAFLPMKATVEVGDEVVTSGDGDVFPANLAVGTVDSVNDGIARVRLSADLSRLDFVNVLDYDPPPPPEENPAGEVIGGASDDDTVAGAGVAN